MAVAEKAGDNFDQADEAYFGSMTIKEESPMLTVSPMLRSKIPLGVNKQVSDITFLSAEFEDAVNQPMLQSTLGVERSFAISTKRATPMLRSPVLSPRQEERKNSNERKPAKGLGDTMSSLASFANMEARFTAKTPFGEMAATYRSPSTEESEASGSDSDPSVDNME